MTIIQKEFRVSTRSRTEMVDITGQVETAVREAGVRNGDVIVFCPHTTAAITINENADPSVVHDILLALGDQSGCQELLSLMGDRGNIRTVILPVSTRFRTSAGNKLVNAAAVSVDDVTGMNWT